VTAPDPGYGWVERTITVDATDTDTVRAIETNGGWRLIGVGKGAHEQTTLTYGWPWPTPAQVDGSGTGGAS